MNTVNRYMINDLLGPIGGGADIDEEVYKYWNLNNNSEPEIKRIITEKIKPHFEESKESYKHSVKNSLSYFLTTDRLNFGRLYDSCLIAFDHPNNAKLFFIWIWEVLFPGENYMSIDVNKFTEIEDLEEPKQNYNLD